MIIGCAVTSDHPYVTSAGILIALALLLSPYVLTALLALFVATGVPRLPAPVRNFLPAPFLEVQNAKHSIAQSHRKSSEIPVLDHNKRT